MKYLESLGVLIIFYVICFGFYTVINWASFGCWSWNTIAVASFWTTILGILFNIWELSKKK